MHLQWDGMLYPLCRCRCVLVSSCSGSSHSFPAKSEVASHVCDGSAKSTFHELSLNFSACSSRSSFCSRNLVMALYHNKLPSRWSGSTFPKAKVRLLPPASAVCTKVGHSCWTVKNASLTPKLAEPHQNFASHASKKAAGTMREMIFPETGENRLSRWGSNHANSLATNLDHRNQMDWLLASCFSRYVLTKRVLNTFKSAGTVEGSWSTCNSPADGAQACRPGRRDGSVQPVSGPALLHWKGMSASWECVPFHDHHMRSDLLYPTIHHHRTRSRAVQASKSASANSNCTALSSCS